MKSIPASLMIIGVATLLAASVAVPASVSAADFPYAYAHHDHGAEAPVVLVAGGDPHRYTRERVWPGYGGPNLEHQFGIHPHDSEKPRNRHYYPYVWGGYAFSAPYFVKRGDYSRPEYEKPAYGKAQARRWGRDHKRPDQWEDGRW
jgi:hypothetical protein